MEDLIPIIEHYQDEQNLVLNAVMMQSVCEDIEKEHPSIQNSDIVTLFQVAHSITSFQFHNSPASTVMSLEIVNSAASLLITFHKVLDEQQACPCKDHENTVTFLNDLVRNMLKKMKSQPLLFVEILFSKSCKERHYINAEFMLHEHGHLRKQMCSQEKVSGTEENVTPSDKGLARRSTADALGDDEADVVISCDQGFQKS